MNQVESQNYWALLEHKVGSKSQNSSPFKGHELQSISEEISHDSIFQILLTQLPDSIRNVDLVRMYNRIGPIHSVKFWTRGNFENSVYGLLTTKSPRLQEHLLSGSHYFEGHQFYCRKYYSKEEKSDYLDDLKQRRVFVKKVPHEIDDSGLLRLIRQRFKVEKAYQIRLKNNQGMGYGYVILATPKEAKSLLAQSKSSPKGL